MVKSSVHKLQRWVRVVPSGIPYDARELGLFLMGEYILCNRVTSHKKLSFVWRQPIFITEYYRVIANRSEWLSQNHWEHTWWYWGQLNGNQIMDMVACHLILYSSCWHCCSHICSGVCSRCSVVNHCYTDKVSGLHGCLEVGLWV